MEGLQGVVLIVRRDHAKAICAGRDTIKLEHAVCTEDRRKSAARDKDSSTSEVSTSKLSEDGTSCTSAASGSWITFRTRRSGGALRAHPSHPAPPPRTRL